MTIRIYNDRIKFVADSDKDTDIDLLIESDGLRFTGTLTTAYNVAYTTPVQSLPAQGTVAAFTSGGFSPPRVNTIDKFPFSISAGTATNVGSLSITRNSHAGHSSNIDGFVSGGSPDVLAIAIDKFPFSISSGTATDVGDLSIWHSEASQHSSYTDGFIGGGYGNPFPTYLSSIDKFPFSISGGTGTDVGDLSGVKRQPSSQSSNTDAFASGGYTGSVYLSTIDKFPFSISGGTATDVGDLSGSQYQLSGVSSTDNGFSAGGNKSGSIVSTIDKFPFNISSGTATIVGDLTTATTQLSGEASTTDGFMSGGNVPSQTPTYTATIDKFPFNISSGTATDVGDLTETKSALAGHQD
jgi:hypothetical protein